MNAGQGGYWNVVPNSAASTAGPSGQAECLMFRIDRSYHLMRLCKCACRCTQRLLHALRDGLMSSRGTGHDWCPVNIIVPAMRTIFVRQSNNHRPGDLTFEQEDLPRRTVLPSPDLICTSDAAEQAPVSFMLPRPPRSVIAPSRALRALNDPLASAPFKWPASYRRHLFRRRHLCHRSGFTRSGR